MLLVADIEADGFNPDVMHCMILIDPQKGIMYEFHNKEDWALEDSIWLPLAELKTFMEKSVTNLVGHNFIGYDIPVLGKLYNINYTGTLTDTLIWSRCLFPDRPKPVGYSGKDSHGLGSWGHRLNRGKPDQSDWSTFTEDMLHRCREDVEINVLVWEELLWEMFCRNSSTEWNKSWMYNPPEYPAWVKMESAVAEAMEQQERDGVNFDTLAANALMDELGTATKEVEDIVLPLLPPVRTKSQKIKTFPACAEEPYTKSGKLKANILKYYQSAIEFYKLDPDSKECTDEILSWLSEGRKVRPTVVVTEKPMKIRSPQFKVWLEEELGWQPTEWNFKKVSKTDTSDPESPYFNQSVGGYATKLGKRVKASPKLTEESYDSIEGSLGPDVKRFLVAAHRWSLVKGLLDSQRDSGVIGAGANSCGAATTRMKHRVVTNIPRIGSPYGEECRALFIPREGRVFVGYDASALEARMEAHYTYPYDDGAYASEVIDGDIHTKNALAFGLFDSSLVEEYNLIEDHDNLKNDREREVYYAFSDGRNGGPIHGGGAKGAKYCLTYGGGAPKLAETLKRPTSEGLVLFEEFWEANPALKDFKTDVEREWREKDGWIKTIDGRHLYARSPHSLVNLKFQSAGSIICKTAIVFLQSWIKREDIDAIKVIDMHDEGQYDCAPKDVERLKELMEKCVEAAGKYWKLNVVTPSEAKSGKNWKETH